MCVGGVSTHMYALTCMCECVVNACVDNVRSFLNPYVLGCFMIVRIPIENLSQWRKELAVLQTTVLAHYIPSHRPPVSSQLSEIKGCFPTALPHFIVWNVGILGIEENNRGGKAAIWISLNCFKTALPLLWIFMYSIFLVTKKDIMLCMLCNFRGRLQHFIPNVFFTLYGWMGICFVFPSTAERKRSFWIQ